MKTFPLKNGLIWADQVGWLVLEAEIQQCDETLDPGSLLSGRSCEEIATLPPPVGTNAAPVTADAAACAAVTGDDLLDAMSCEAVMTAADGAVSACTYR